MKHRKAFTLVEAIMVIVIIAILAISGAFLMVYTVKNGVVMPNQLNMDMLASNALDIMIEGDGQAKGLRFSKSITALADNQIDFVNQNEVTMRYRLNTGTGKLYRKIGAAPETLLPYYLGTGISVSGESNKIFTYYDASESVTAVPASVRRIELSLIAKTGTGSYSDWESQSTQRTSIAVRRYQ